MDSKAFEVYVNEGAFFYEPWLVDNSVEPAKHYRYDRIPAQVMVRFIEEKKQQCNADEDEARIVFDYALAAAKEASRP